MASVEQSQGQGMRYLEWWTEDRHFGVRLPTAVLRQIFRECERAKDVETGGIIVGHYNPRHDCAKVSAVSVPPSDSHHSRRRFIRGVRGLQKWIDRLWTSVKKRYYLGEWHFHPGGQPVPSEPDTVQMANIASSHKYNCPEPLLMIVGGNRARGFTAAVYVFHGGLIQMNPRQIPDQFAAK